MTMCLPVPWRVHTRCEGKWREHTRFERGDGGCTPGVRGEMAGAFHAAARKLWLAVLLRVHTRCEKGRRGAVSDGRAAV